MRPCKIEGCTNCYYRRGYCWRHYFQYEATQEEKNHRADKAREYAQTSYARKKARERALQWAKDNPEKVKQSNWAYYETHTQQVLDYQKKSHSQHKKRFGVSRSAKFKIGYVAIDKGTKVPFFVTGVARRFNSEWHVLVVRAEGGEDVLLPTATMAMTGLSRAAFMTSREIRAKLGVSW